MQDALEVARLARSWQNRLAPVNRIPPEVLTTILDFISEHGKRNVVLQRLTHMCSAWRAIFTLCPLLWADFDCTNTEQTRAYIKRSKTSPQLTSRCERWSALREPLLPSHSPHPRSSQISIFGRDIIEPSRRHRPPFLSCTSP